MLRSLVLTLLLAGCAASNTSSLGETRAAPPELVTTTQLLGPSGELRGTATLTQTAGGTRVEARVENLPRGVYAIHVHAIGKCEPATKFESAGPHFNPGAKQHGRDNPAGPHHGDLPNIDVDMTGIGRLDATVAPLALVGGAAPALDADGAAVVLHAGPDDHRTDPAGNSGDRIACGVVARR